MKEKKERVISIMIPLLFLLVILFLNAAGYYDRTFYACGPRDFFSLDRGRYRVCIDTEDSAADSCQIYYTVNGQEHILACERMKPGVGGSFEIKLPSNIRNDNVRAALLDESGAKMPRIDVMRITRVLPVRQTAVYLVMYLIVILVLYRLFGGFRASCVPAGCVSAALIPLYPVFCEAPGQMTALIVTGMSLLFLADRKWGISRESIVRYMFFLALSLIALYFCTESSPFYARNPWDDAGIYYSIGRGITQGYVPYRDMFDHKGPVVFFLYALGYLLAPDCFYGVYLLESLCFSGVLYFTYKIGSLYLDDNTAQALSVVSVIFFLDGSFLVYGGSCEEFTMVIYMAVLYGYLSYFSGRKECGGRRLAGAGVLCGLTFWMKFNMTMCLFVLVGMVMLHRLMSGHNIIKDIAAFAGGFMGVSVSAVGYFICQDSVGYLKSGYFDANLAYADVKSLGETFAAFGQNVLLAVCDNPGVTLVVVFGLLGFVISSGYIGDKTGKIGLATAFVVLVGSTYISYAYLYYYCLVAVFVILGLVVAAKILTDMIGKGKVRKEATFYLVLPCLCMLLVCNQNHKDAAVFSENFTLYDVCEKEMENASKGQDKTLLMYRNHWVQMMTFADVKPAGQYYFAPNISKNIPEINEEQDRYIHEGASEFVLVDHVELYPNFMEWGLYRYEQILDWCTDRDSVQLYRLRR